MPSMRSTFRWSIAFIVITSLLYLINTSKFDLEQLWKWEIIVAVILSIIIWFVFLWRRTMRLKKFNVTIQLLNE